MSQVEEGQVQVFLASHHDEMTSKLVQYLRPPPGCKIRILDFRSWKAGEGPVFDLWTVENEAPRREKLHTGDPAAQSPLQGAMDLSWYRPPPDRG